MPRTLSTNNQAGTALAITEPVWLLDLDFSTPIRLSSREDITYESNAYVGIDMSVQVEPGKAKIRFFTTLAHSATMIGEGTGVAATLYKVYGQAPFSTGDADIWFDGVCGPIQINKDAIELELAPAEPFVSPIHRATQQNFSHLPPDGLQIQTRQGTFVLRSDK